MHVFVYGLVHMFGLVMFMPAPHRPSLTSLGLESEMVRGVAQVLTASPPRFIR
jgi:hypothetical protein